MPRTGVWVMAGRHVASAMVILAAGDKDANMNDALPPPRPGNKERQPRCFALYPQMPHPHWIRGCSDARLSQ